MMLDSIFIGMSGLQSFSTGLRVIGNNVSNLNTAGFKSTSLSFSELYYQSSGGESGWTSSDGAYGTGVSPGETFTNFKAGDTVQTGNPLDAAISGEGLFVLRDTETGALSFTRAGQFEFGSDGILLHKTSGFQVMGLGAGGELTEMSLNGFKLSPPKASAVLTMAGNLSSTATSYSIDATKVIDSAGGEHTLKLTFKPKTGAVSTWTVTVAENGVDIGSGEVVFAAGAPVEGANKFDISWQPAKADSQTLRLDFSSGVTSFNTGTTSNLQVSKNDGFALGSVSTVALGTDGSLNFSYSNGQKATGGQVALAKFDDANVLRRDGGALFSSGLENVPRTYGWAGTGGLGALTASQVEGSNVDLSAEFTQLIVTQRGYQASSRVLSTANEMLQDLFSLKSGK